MEGIDVVEKFSLLKVNTHHGLLHFFLTNI